MDKNNNFFYWNNNNPLYYRYADAIFQNSIEQDDTKAIDMDSPIFEEELIPITEEDMKSIPEDTIKFR